MLFHLLVSPRGLDFLNITKKILATGNEIGCGMKVSTWWGFERRGRALDEEHVTPIPDITNNGEKCTKQKERKSWLSKKVFYLIGYSWCLSPLPKWTLGVKVLLSIFPVSYSCTSMQINAHKILQEMGNCKQSRSRYHLGFYKYFQIDVV